MNNERAFAMIESRFSDQVKLFNSYDVSEADSDAHYWAVKGRAELARVALDRAAPMTVTTLARSLGDIYRAIRKNLTASEYQSWEEFREILDSLSEKYGI